MRIDCKRILNNLNNRRNLSYVIIGSIVIVLCTCVMFRLSLSTIGSQDIDDLTAYETLYADQATVQTLTANEIHNAWKQRYKSEPSSNMSLGEMAKGLGIQPKNPGDLADLVIVGTYAGTSTYAYNALVNEIEVEQVLSPLGSSSKLNYLQQRYDIPKLDIQAGSHLAVYDEFSISHTTSNDVNLPYAIQPSVSSNAFTLFLTPFRKHQRYLLFLNYVPKDEETASLATARFSLSPTIYSKISISDEPASKRVYNANLPVDNTDSSTAAPFNTVSQNTTKSDLDDRYAQALMNQPSHTLAEARQYDLFVENDSVGQIYLENAARILNLYGL